MPVDLIIRPKAKGDIIEQALYIADGDPEAAERFLDALERAFSTLCDMPEIGSVRDFSAPELEGIRMWPVKGFEKHLIFYRPLEDHVEVVRILHASRDIPGIMQTEHD